MAESWTWKNKVQVIQKWGWIKVAMWNEEAGCWDAIRLTRHNGQAVKAFKEALHAPDSALRG